MFILETVRGICQCMSIGNILWDLPSLPLAVTLCKNLRFYCGYDLTDGPNDLTYGPYDLVDGPYGRQYNLVQACTLWPVWTGLINTSNMGSETHETAYQTLQAHVESTLYTHHIWYKVSICHVSEVRHSRYSHATQPTLLTAIPVGRHTYRSQRIACKPTIAARFSDPAPFSKFSVARFQADLQIVTFNMTY